MGRSAGQLHFGADLDDLVKAAEKRINNPRIKLSAFFFLYDFSGVVNGKRVFVGSFRGKRVECVRKSDNSARERNSIACEPPGIAGAIPSFVVGKGNLSRQA